MKSELKKPTTETPKFPCLARHKGDKSIVLFTDEKKGIVLTAGIYYPLGDIATWVNISDSEVWEILPAGTQLTLTQE